MSAKDILSDEEIPVSKGMMEVGQDILFAFDTSIVDYETWAARIYRAMVRAREAEARGEVVKGGL